MTRDSQRQRVYDSESDLRALSSNRYLGGIYECQQFVDAVMDRAYVKKHYSKGIGWPIIVIGNPRKYSKAHANCGGSRIELGTGDAAKWSRSRVVVLHELAHILAYRKYLDHTGSHNWQFAKVFHDLVRNVMGKDAADCLKLGYKFHTVRYKEPRKCYMTPAQKQAAAARLKRVV